MDQLCFALVKARESLLHSIESRASVNLWVDGTVGRVGLGEGIGATRELEL